jgi:rhodanese-related sulfurtransferase
MLKRTLFYLSCVVLLLSASSCVEAAGESIQTVSHEEAQLLLDSDQVQLVDVRREEQYNQRQIAGAVNIDLEDESFNKILDTMDRDQPLLIYCNQGTKSERCAKILQEKGFQKIYDLDGGLTKWEASGRKVILKNQD